MVIFLVEPVFSKLKTPIKPKATQNFLLDWMNPTAKSKAGMKEINLVEVGALVATKDIEVIK